MQHRISTPDLLEPKGMIRLKTYRAGTIDAMMPHLLLARRLRHAAGDGQGIIRSKMMERVIAADALVKQILEEGFIETAVECPNLIMQGALTGKDLFVQYLCATGLVGATIYPGGINYAGIGSGSTAPTVSDTQLQTEVVRVAIANAIDFGYNQAQLQFFFTDALLANGTYREVGTFMNATGTANSGKIFNRSLLGTPYVKTTGIDTTLEVDITLT